MSTLKSSPLPPHSSPSKRARAVAGATALSLGGFALAGLGSLRPASVYASGLSTRSFALPCTGTPVADDTALQAAITNSVDDSVICIAQSITLSQTLVLDDTRVTLVGDDSTVTLTAPGNNRHIRADSPPRGDDTLTIMDLTLAGGRGADGGSIKTDEDVVVERSTFTDNRATSSGGAIFTFGSVTTTDADFTDNDASARGGAIYAGGSVTNTDSAFTENDANTGGGAISANGSVTTTDTDFTDNTANSAGAIQSLGSVTTNGGTFTNNTATLTPFTGGGAISANGSVTTTDTDFTDNTANYAGAIRAGGSVTANGGTFTENTASSQGGAIDADDTVLVSYATFAANTAGTEGGAIFTVGPVTARNSTFFMNSADTRGAAVKASAISLAFVTSVDDSSAADSAFWAVAPPGNLTMVGSVISPAVGGGSACNTLADDFSYDSFATDASCGSGDDTVTITTRGSLEFDDTLVTDPSTGAQVLIPDNTSVLVGAAPFDLVPSVTLDQLGTTRGPVTTTVGAVQVSSAPPPPPTPVIPPGAPGEVVAIAGNRSAEVTWSAPGSAGSFPITTYQVANDIDGATCLLSVGPDTPLACQITGLTNGATYRFRVRALNGAGWSAWSPWSEAVAPEPTPPPMTKSIVITGMREGRFARVVGVTTGIQADQVITRVKLGGQTRYRTGVPRTITPEGAFTWQRVTNPRIFVYFAADGIRSNRVIIEGRR